MVDATIMVVSTRTLIAAMLEKEVIFYHTFFLGTRFASSFEDCDYYEVAFSISLLRHATGLVRLVRAAREREKVKKRSKASCSPSLRCQKAQLDKEKAFSWLSLVLVSSRSKSRVPTKVSNQNLIKVYLE